MLRLVLMLLHLAVINSVLVNIALNKSTTTVRSGRITNGGHSAVDGNTSNISCISLFPYTWLRIDLDTTMKVHAIILHRGSQPSSDTYWNKTEVCVSPRPEMTEPPDDEYLCNLSSNTEASSLHVSCRNQGRFVFVRNTFTSIPSLCEVQVYVCTNGSYGAECSQSCGYCGGGSCDADTGVCGGGGCMAGYSGSNCDIHEPDTGMSAPVAGVIGAVILLLVIAAIVAAVICYFCCMERRGAAAISRQQSVAPDGHNNSLRDRLRRSRVGLVFTSLLRPREPTVSQATDAQRRHVKSTHQPARSAVNSSSVLKKSVSDKPGAAVNVSSANNSQPTDLEKQPGFENTAFEDDDSEMYEVPIHDPLAESEYLAMGAENVTEDNYVNQGTDADDDDQPVYEAMEITGEKEETDQPSKDGEC
ncbi:uncharacterized protein LOC124141822 [Haliotis rufescens]|uniref:uncharacterized protein LOC124141822 n=1 Tax=Haliotis rufescens TaxID=6454 RepID=UPI00201F5138|nr:uncharacterized protein LOC124141822 [Haliotis rufescens]